MVLEKSNGVVETCDPYATKCCATRVMSLQPDFQEQRSLVQETIENAGHLCIFLWGVVKRYLREHCDNLYEGLQANLLKALESVNIFTIRK